MFITLMMLFLSNDYHHKYTLQSHYSDDSIQWWNHYPHDRCRKASILSSSISFPVTRWVSEALCWSRWTSKRTGSMTSSRCALLGFHIKFDQIPSSTCDLPSVYEKKGLVLPPWGVLFLMYRLYRLVLFLSGAVYNLTYHGSAFSAFSTPHEPGMMTGNDLPSPALSIEFTGNGWLKSHLTDHFLFLTTPEIMALWLDLPHFLDEHPRHQVVCSLGFVENWTFTHSSCLQRGCSGSK